MVCVKQRDTVSGATTVIYRDRHQKKAAAPRGQQVYLK